MNVQAVSMGKAPSGVMPSKNRAVIPSASCGYIAKGRNLSDSFTNSDSFTQEQKYDFACRLIAYYKTQYENLKQGFSCAA